MKICLGCGVEKPEDEFPYRSKKTGKRKPRCKVCHNAEYRQYCIDNPEKRRESILAYDEKPASKEAKKRRVYKYREDQSEKYQEYRSAHYRKNIEKITRANARWRAENPDRYDRINANWRKRNMHRVISWAVARNARKLGAIPKWADPAKMELFYQEARRMTEITGIPHAVDHIVPLRSELVCGLHCEGNLQILTRTENSIKSNRWWPDMPLLRGSVSQNHGPAAR